MTFTEETFQKVCKSFKVLLVVVVVGNVAHYSVPLFRSLLVMTILVLKTFVERVEDVLTVLTQKLLL